MKVAHGVAVCLAIACASAIPDLADISSQDESPQAVDQTIRYLLRDRTLMRSATRSLKDQWHFQVKSGAERQDELIETFGRHHHGKELSDMGFDLLEVEERGAFTGSGYHNPQQLHKAFEELVSKHPEHAKLFDLTTEYKQPKTIEGRHMYAFKLSANAAKDESKPNVLIVSNHHARELITPELALNFAHRLLDGNEKARKLESGELGEGDMDSEDVAEAQDAKDILDKNQVYVMWTMNPDGLNTVWSSDSWKRTNGRNVDLNRNYPVGWSLSCGGSTNQGGETFRGPHPFSEPETKTMKAFQENRNFAKVMDFHSYAQQVRTNYANCVALPGGIDKDFEGIRDKVAHKMGYEASRSCCMGGNIHYAYNKHGSLAYLVETGTAFQPSSAEKDATVEKVWPGMKKFLQQPIAVSGIVTDEKTGNPLKAELKLPEYKFTQGEKLTSGERGHYHLWLPEGKHKVEVHAEGKDVKTVTVESTPKGNVQHIKV